MILNYAYPTHEPSYLLIYIQKAQVIAQTNRDKTCDRPSLLVDLTDS
jgi:hypothetical protein